MATVKRVSTAVPSRQRSMLIPDAAVGDKIDVEAILGRPARTVKFFMTDVADVLEFRLNNLLRLRKFNETGADQTVFVWSVSDSFPVYSATDSEIHITEEMLDVSSIEIVGLTLSAGTTIEIVVC
jgi:hypothetical protein